MKALKAVSVHGALIEDNESFKEIRNIQISYINAFEIDPIEYTRIFGTAFLEYMQRIYSPAGDPATGRNYYALIYAKSGVNQVESVIQRLRDEPLSRSATIVLASLEAKKQPCVTELNFSIRHGLLHMNAIFKSSDLAKKFVPDMVELSRIHMNISHALNIARGEVTAHILSAQVYEQDAGVVRDAIGKRRLQHYFKTNRIIENWDQEAQEWDLNIQKPEHYVNIENGYARFLDFLNEQLPHAQLPQLRALDSGCGTGAIARVLQKKGYEVTALDISPKMLEFAQKNSVEAHYVRANSLDIPYPDLYFDAVCSRGVLISHVGKEYVELFIQEHARILKHDGLFLFDFITNFKPDEVSNRRTKASMNYSNITNLLLKAGFQVVARSGTDENRVNAIVCKKIA